MEPDFDSCPTIGLCGSDQLYIYNELLAHGRLASHRGQSVRSHMAWFDCCEGSGFRGPMNGTSRAERHFSHVQLGFLKIGWRSL